MHIRLADDETSVGAHRNVGRSPMHSVPSSATRLTSSRCAQYAGNGRSDATPAVDPATLGWTRTELADDGYRNDRFRDVTTSRTPVRRGATGDDYHELAAYLCDREVLWHTGDSVVADGGYTIF
jgi:hypothetical protein